MPSIWEAIFLSSWEICHLRTLEILRINARSSSDHSIWIYRHHHPIATSHTHQCKLRLSNCCVCLCIKFFGDILEDKHYLFSQITLQTILCSLIHLYYTIISQHIIWHIKIQTQNLLTYNIYGYWRSTNSRVQKVNAANSRVQKYRHMGGAKFKASNSRVQNLQMS